MKLIKITPDKVGVSLSFLCAIHCAITPLLLTFLPLWGLGFLASHELEFALIALSLLIAGYVLWKDYRNIHQNLLPASLAILGFVLIFSGHVFHSLEILFAVFGGMIVTFSYLLNWKINQKMKACCHEDNCA